MSRGYTPEEAKILEEGWFFYDHAWLLAHHIMSKFVGASCLDVGCGTGMALGIYKNCKLDMRFHGCEPNDVCRQLWIRRGLDVDTASATDLPYGDNSFDTVVASHVIEHIDDEQLAIKEMSRVASQRLIVIVPQGDVDDKNLGSPHLRHYNRVNFVGAFDCVTDAKNKHSYILPHWHIDNLVMQIDF